MMSTCTLRYVPAQELSWNWENSKIVLDLIEFAKTFKGNVTYGVMHPCEGTNEQI